MPEPLTEARLAEIGEWLSRYHCGARCCYLLGEVLAGIPGRCDHPDTSGLLAQIAGLDAEVDRLRAENTAARAVARAALAAWIEADHA